VPVISQYYVTFSSSASWFDWITVTGPNNANGITGSIVPVKCQNEDVGCTVKLTTL
jgi:hypothetical protein